MSPTSRASSRLGWVMLITAVVYAAIMVGVSGFWGIALCGLFGVGVSCTQDSLYRWVTEPERASNEDPLI